jgi:hypothetical protein
MPHNTTPHPTDDTEKRGASIAAKKAMGSQLEGASDEDMPAQQGTACHATPQL